MNGVKSTHDDSQLATSQGSMNFYKILLNVNINIIRVMIQPQTLVQTYFVQTDVA